MLIGERRLKIIDLLQEKGNVIVSELSSLLSVTEETIRRDLEGLEKEGLLKRTYGGAMPRTLFLVFLQILKILSPESHSYLLQKESDFSVPTVRL